MKKYSPGANIKFDYYHVCDCCKKDDGRSVVMWEKLPGRKGHFVLCHSCIKNLYLKHVACLDKEKKFLIIKRHVISEKLRNKIFKRDGWQCVKCKTTKNLQIDHIIPFIVGGTTDEKNLQTLCKTCNLSKRDK